MPTTESTLAPAVVASGQAIQLGSIEQVLAQGDLAKMSPDDRTRYLVRVCETLNLNVYTRPFQYIMLSGKLTLYATRDAADQLRKLHGVSIRIADRTRQDDIYIVTAEATDRTGRTDSSIGAVSVAGLKGEALANAFMKAETKAKRRVTLSVCGLGFLDETEVETVPNTTRVEQPALPALAGGEPAASRPLQQAPPPDPSEARRPPHWAVGPRLTGEQVGRFMVAATKVGYDDNQVRHAVHAITGRPVHEMTAPQSTDLLAAFQAGQVKQDGDGRWVIEEPPAEADRRGEV